MSLLDLMIGAPAASIAERRLGVDVDGVSLAEDI